MKVIKWDRKLFAVFSLLSFLASEVTTRSFRKSRDEGTTMQSLTSDKSFSSGFSSGIPDSGDTGGSEREWKWSRIHNLVNVLENKFSGAQPGETPRLSTHEDSSLSEEEQEMIKKRILDGLGMTTIPTRNLSNIPEEEIELAYKDYLKAVQEEQQRYEDLQTENEYSDETEEDSDEDTKQHTKQSSFRFFSTTSTTNKLHSRGRRSAEVGQEVVHFSVSLPSSATANNSRVVEATAHFWKKGLQPVRDDHSNTTTSSTVEVSFYRLDDIPRRRSHYASLDPIHLATQNVSIFGNGWIDLDMSAAVRQWLTESRTNTGVLIRCSDCETLGIRFMTGGRRRKLAHGGKMPRLDVRTEVIGVRRVKRSRKLRKSMRRRGHRHPDCYDATHSRGKRSNRCCRRSMQVRFADLPRFDFILSPKEFDAYYCSGKCPARYNPANEHALLQSLLNLRGKSNVPGPCCAPTKLKGLNILHIGDDGRIRTTYWEDVIVTECGCA